jgi:hypothetical protein
MSAAFAKRVREAQARVRNGPDAARWERYWAMARGEDLPGGRVVTIDRDGNVRRTEPR